MELTFNFKGNLYYVKDYSYIHMPIPMTMTIPMCQYQDFEVALSMDFVSFVWKTVWFSILFNAYQAFWRDFQSQQDKPCLTFTYSKAAIKTLE